MNEIWKPIPSLPGYEASNAGRIRNQSRVLAQFVHQTERSSYMRVQVWIDAKRKNRRVNRLVCEAFHGPAPAGDAHARHKDGDAFNNESENLAWATAAENFRDQIVHGTANMPPNIEDVGDLANIWHKKPAKSVGQLKFQNKIKMLRRKMRGSSQLP